MTNVCLLLLGLIYIRYILSVCGCGIYIVFVTSHEVSVSLVCVVLVVRLGLGLWIRGVNIHSMSAITLISRLDL